MRNAVLAVLYGLRHRPSVWLVCGVGWILYGTFSAKGIPLIIYRTGDASYRDLLLPALLPTALPGSLLSAYPLFGAIFMIALAGIVVGNEYRWATMGTLLVQRVSRTVLALAHAAALAVVTLVTVVLYAVVNAAVSFGIAIGLGVPVVPPDPLPLLVAVGGSWLIAFAYGMIGALVAHLFRSAVAAVVAAVVLVVGLENVVGLLVGVVPALEVAQYVLPGPSGGALALAAGATPGVPGLVGVAPAAVAVLVLLGWVAIGVLGSVGVLRYRDVAG